MSDEPLQVTSGEEIGAEASRYLAVLATFEELRADPHAEVRMCAARARECEDEVRRGQAATKKRGICRWTS
jgi:hypothetical protein